MDPAKVEAITSWPTPKSIHDIRVFLGLANFYQHFIKDFSKITAPITNLLKKSQKLHWGMTAETAFGKLKEAFTSAPSFATLIHPFLQSSKLTLPTMHLVP